MRIVGSNQLVSVVTGSAVPVQYLVIRDKSGKVLHTGIPRYIRRVARKYGVKVKV